MTYVWPQVTNRRVNALENVIIPRLENTVKCTPPHAHALPHCCTVLVQWGVCREEQARQSKPPPPVLVHTHTSPAYSSFSAYMQSGWTPRFLTVRTLFREA